MYNQHTFDWSVTKRKLVLFIPCFGRLQYLKTTLKRFKTSANNKDWCILVANDGIHQDLTSLERDYNLYWFTFERDPVERNGVLVRNFVIKRIQSEYLACRDPEIFLEHSTGKDYISRLLDLEGDVVYRPKYYTELKEHETQKIIRNPKNIDLTKLDVLRKWVVRNNEYQGFHWGMCCRTHRLKKMKGYDEDFADSFGWEDVHLLKRLQKDNVKFIIDDQMTGYHVWHCRKPFCRKTIDINGKIYNNKMKNLQVVANQNREWGED